MAAQKPLELPNHDILDFEYDDFTEDEENPKTPTRPGGKSIRIDQPPKEAKASGLINRQQISSTSRRHQLIPT